MDDTRDLERDYVRRLEEALTNAGVPIPPLVDESRVRKGTFITTAQVLAEVDVIFKKNMKALK